MTYLQRLRADENLITNYNDLINNRLKNCKSESERREILAERRRDAMKWEEEMKNNHKSRLAAIPIFIGITLAVCISSGDLVAALFLPLLVGWISLFAGMHYEKQDLKEGLERGAGDTDTYNQYAKGLNDGYKASKIGGAYTAYNTSKNIKHLSNPSSWKEI